MDHELLAEGAERRVGVRHQHRQQRGEGRQMQAREAQGRSL
jgi:hypothetical protein